MMHNNRRWSFTCSRMLSLTLAVAVLASGVEPGTSGTVSARERASPRLVQDLSNTAPLAIIDGAQPARSTILVSGFDTEIADIDVTIRNLNHGQAGEIDMLLVGPGGQTAMVLSDVGSSASNVTLTLDDQATNQVPSSGPLTSGRFQPTNFQSGDTFGPPAPASPSSGSELGVFNGTNPNGVWTLFIQDDTSGTTGVLNGGWSLRIVSANGVPNAAPDAFQVKAGKSLRVLSGVLENDRDPDGDPLTAILAGQPRKGVLQFLPDGTFTYKAKKKAKGTDTFTYLAQDPGGLSDLETVTISIKKAKKKRRK